MFRSWFSASPREPSFVSAHRLDGDGACAAICRYCSRISGQGDYLSPGTVLHQETA